MNKKAQALIVTIAVLSVLLIIGLSLLVLTFYEVRHSRIYLDSIKAQYLAEAGIVLASEFLSLDKESNKSDSFNDFFYDQIKGEDVDLNEDAENESLWFRVENSQGGLYGRFALRVIDEAGKLNLNYCGERSSPAYGLDFSEIDINPLFSSLGINKKASLVERRFGQDKAPGKNNIDDDSDNPLLSVDGIDNDFDGLFDESNEGVDEPDEQGYGDDRLFLVTEEALDLLEVPKDVRFKDYFTVYSKEREVDYFEELRVYLNTYFPRDVVLNFLLSGVSSPFQKAANFIDYQDKDFEQTVLDKFYKIVDLPGPSGGGFINKGGYFVALPSSGESTFSIQNLDIEDGQYFCFFHSPFRGSPVGYVSVGDISDCDVYAGEGLFSKVNVEAGSLSVKIKPFDDEECYVSHIELISLDKKDGLEHISVRGRESLVINEILAKPSSELVTIQDQDPKGAWVWKDGFYENAEFASGKSGEGKWVFAVNKSGYFYIKVFANSPGGYIGDVSIAGKDLRDARDGMIFSEPVYINDNLTLTIQNNSLVEIASFKSLVISQEPDTEFIEILNISPYSIDISDFTVEITQEGGGSLGWPALIPQGTQIEAYQHLILSIDKDDRDCALFLRNNGIFFQKTWGMSSVQLQFTGAVEGNDDIIPNKKAKVTLKDSQARVVDTVEYKSEQVSDFTSVEKSDPTLFWDNDANGIFDAWFFSESLAKATPGERNDNPGMKEIDPVTLEVFYHDVREQVVQNNPFINIGYANDVASDFAWEKFDLRSISLLADKFTSFRKHLGFGSFLGGAFEETEEGFYSSRKGDTGVWRWPNIAEGIYSLKILASEDSSSSLSVDIKLGDEISGYLGPFAFDKGWLNYGNIEIKDDSESLEINLRNEEDKPLLILNFILEPQFQARGRININTASKEVLSALTDGPTALRVISYRPFGERTNRRLGIGDLLQDTSLGFTPKQKIDNFKLIAPLITTHSDIYEVVCLGEYIVEDQKKASHRIEAIIER
ncbi:MAG: general secretion pathway protein GspK [Candidatus Omnitrophica bacterium]|nr:general secretion pathway protein GspK [Candidatus Omnitrophota bacterium]